MLKWLYHISVRLQRCSSFLDGHMPEPLSVGRVANIGSHAFFCNQSPKRESNGIESMQAILRIDDIKSLELEIARRSMSGLRFMFRGQSNASWPIQTTLFRKYREGWNSNNCWLEYIEEYYSKKEQIISKEVLAFKPNREDEDYFILSALRHLGFPCHLIDWSASLRTAIFFACLENKDLDGCLFVLATDLPFNNYPISVSPFDVDVPIIICKEFDLIPTDKTISDFPIGRLRRFRQNGFMSIIPRGFISESFESLLNDNYSLKKLIIPAASKSVLFDYLNRNNSYYDFIMANSLEANTNSDN